MNLLVDADWHIKVSDFGLARTKATSHAYTQVSLTSQNGRQRLVSRLGGGAFKGCVRYSRVVANTWILRFSVVARAPRRISCNPDLNPQYNRRFAGGHVGLDGA